MSEIKWIRKAVLRPDETLAVTKEEEFVPQDDQKEPAKPKNKKKEVVGG